jgi:hypothetical protein
MSVGPRLERFVLAEFALRERRGRRADRSHCARVLAERLHHGRDELLAHLRRVSRSSYSGTSIRRLRRARCYLVYGPFPRPRAWLVISRVVVARAGIEDRLDRARPTGDTLAALMLLPDPRRAR